MISKIRTEAERNQGVVSVYPIIRFGMFELLLFMCFGYHMKEEEIFEISELLDAILKLTAMQLFDFLPFLKLLRRNREVSERELRSKQVDLFSSHFQNHKELKEIGQLTRGSYLETLLRTDLSTEDVVTLCTEFMAGGTDTTVTTLEWTMAHLVRNPSIQSKLYCH
ncbi:hypothetical protein KP509_10G066200 [Ceratopteris richardii]|uniref:Cytochrome P450 n=1 Tax=Ceratopteris richardii TaxID=49495 RepID=A0A8T2U2X8_CERRI|nr:hypothetical protein KP509_10G066200 [Ceratopteris richardii]